MYDIFLVSKNIVDENLWKDFSFKYPGSIKLDNVKTFEDIRKKSFTKMFWVIWDDVVLDPNFDIRSYYATKWDDMYIHIFKNGEHKDGICLFPKNVKISQKEFDHRFFLEKKEVEIVASVPKKYNVYTPKNYSEYLEIKDEMFWVVWPEIEVIDESIFDLYFSHHNDYDRNENHMFKNQADKRDSFENGIVLCSLYKKMSQREFDNRYLVNKKEHDKVASRFYDFKSYSVYKLTTYEEYLKIVEKETQPMFWGVWPEVEVTDESVFEMYFDLRNREYDYDRSENHIFKNSCNSVKSYQNGIVLFSKKKPISKKEFDHRYLVDKKEHDRLVSKSKYPVYHFENYDQYIEAFEKETQPMFWGVWPEIEITDKTIFDLYFDPRDGQYDYDRKVHHVFENAFGQEKSFYNGLVLFSSQQKISQKEFERRYVIDKKEHNRLVSKSGYSRYVLSDYDEYLDILEKETRPMFWGIWPEVEVTDESIFEMYFDPRNGKYDHDRSENHVFMNFFKNKKNNKNGIVLFSKHKKISRKEFNSRFLVEKKEHDIVASRFKPYDIIFISYDEPNADKNYQNLTKRFPRALRVHGVKGIHKAHIEAAKIAKTELFFVVDGDAEIVDTFNFDYEVDEWDRDSVFVWRSKNPINGLEYGYGGIKLLPRRLTLQMNIEATDMTTSISKKFKIIEEVSNYSNFNTDPFNTWKSAFRECVKLSSKLIPGQVDKETEYRLAIWKTMGAEELFGKYAIAGAISGAEYGEKNRDDKTALNKINDFEWLRIHFENELILSRSKKTSTL